MGKGKPPRPDRDETPCPPANPLLWPLVATAATSQWVAGVLDSFAHSLLPEGAPSADPRTARWASDNDIALELPTMRLRAFSRDGAARPALICGPFALHAANVADFAPEHSLVEALQRAGIARVYVTDWRSATPDMRYFTIDTYLADLNIAVDELGAPVDLIGLCQGGWLALVYAARFPAKVRRLVVAGAPVDIAAAESALSRMVGSLPPETFAQLVRLGEGLVPGRRVLELWSPTLENAWTEKVLQLPGGMAEAERANIVELFREWFGYTVDLPGVYFMQVVEWLFRDNRIAAGTFVALGRAIDLADIRAPIYLLAGRDDDLIAPAQLLAVADRVGTAKRDIVTATERCAHLSLFLGRRVLAQRWPTIARWLTAEDTARPRVTAAGPGR